MEALKSRKGYINLLHLPGGGTWSSLLTELGSFALDQGLANDGIVDALLERETAYPTGIGSAIGVAIPHTDQKYTGRRAMVVAVLDAPVSFRPMGGGDADIPVEVVFLLLMQDSGKHVDLLRTVANFIQSRERLESLRGADAIGVLSENFDHFFEA